MITGINVKKDANPLTKNEKKQIKKQINLMMDDWRKLKEMEQQKCFTPFNISNADFTA
jgi:flagellar assembly factor FliW